MSLGVVWVCRHNGNMTVEVDGFGKEKFIGYTVGHAKREYRASYGLKHKRIQWLVITEA